jgi:PBSX family phage terminase large subunit
MQVRVSDIVARPHLKYFNSNATHQIDHGGRGGYKSSKNAIKIAIKMIEDPECETVVIRQDKVDHRKSTFRDLITAFEERLGYKLVAGKNYPEGKTGHLWIQLPKGNMVHFEQMKSIDKVKGIRPSANKKIKIVWFFEITEYKSAWYITEANSGLDRGGGKDFMWHLYEFNDAPKLSHWTYEWLKEMENHPDCYIKKTNYNDTPEWQQRKFLGEQLIKEINILKEISPEMYKSVYLGMPANLSGSVYKMFKRENHLQQPTNDYVDIWVGVDFGGNDATVFTAVGVKKGYQGLEVFKTKHHKNGKDTGVKNINDYKEDLLQFCAEVFVQHRKPITVFIDPANLTFKQIIIEATYTKEYKFIMVDDIVKRSSDKNKTSVQERIDLTEIMFGSNFITINPECKQLIKAIEEAEYNDKNERADDGRSDIDSLDSFEYAWLKEKKLIREIILG